MKNLCLSGLAPRFGAVALLVGASGLAATAGCSATPPAGTGGEAPATSSSGSSGTGRMGGATTSSATSTSSGGGMGGAGGAGGAGGTSSSSGTGGDGGQGGAPFVPPVGTAEYPAETEQNSVKSSANVLQMGTQGFTGSLWPLGDIDVFKVDVTVDSSQLTVGIGDGMGGCPAGASTYLRVLDKSGALLAADKTSGPGNCSLLLSKTTPALQSLAVGTYYFQVENLTFAPLPFYVLDVNIAPPTCGDGIVQLGGGEQCDDGANLAGDGCSSSCKLEGLYGTEVEPNGTTATANPMGAQNGILASIGTLTDQDNFSFAVTVPGSSVTLTVDDGLGQCPAAFDSKMYLLDAGGVEITSDNDSGPGNCSTISSTMYPAAASLAVGTYYVRVEEFGGDATTPFYVLGVKIKPPACGDGILQVGEQCDDSNLTSGDGCSTTCGLEGNFIPETEPNDTQLTSNPLGAADGLIGSISPIGDQDYFSFDIVTPGSSVFVEVTDGLNGCPSGFDSTLTLFNPGNVMISSVDDGGIAKCSRISPATTSTAANMAPGKYRVRVEYSGNTVAVASYVVKIKVVLPSCGDAVIQPGEQCDDGNLAAGDGCGSTCQAEAPHEIEPNGTLPTATPQWPGVSNWLGAIYPAGDHDYYTFTLAAAGTVKLTTHTVNNAATCPGDTLLHLTSSAGVELLNNDDALAGTGVPPCSSLTKALAAGTYYAWVQRYQDLVTIPAYQLDLTVQ